MGNILLKKIFKKTIPFLPGYHWLCLVLRKIKPKEWKWVDRIPVKPGMIVVVHSKVGDFQMGCPERCSIAKKFFWTHGISEPAEDRKALDLFAYLAKCSEVVLDIGANSGLFSLMAAKSNPDAQVIAFDIFPEAYHISVDNLILNNLLGKVEIQLTGVGPQGKIFYAPFYNISSEMPTSLSLDYKTKSCRQIQVPVKTLDEICIPRFVGKKLCIKIDVEGTEADIFKYGLDTLTTIKPDIICEVISNARQVQLYDKILKDCLYRKYLITDEGLKRFDIVKPDKRYKDWFFTAKNNPEIENIELLT